MFSGDPGGRWALRPCQANASPAFGQYQYDDQHHMYRPFAIQVIELQGLRIAAITAFLEPKLFPRFGLPESVERS